MTLRRHLFYSLFILLFILINISTLTAQTKNWQGNTTDWHTASNWSPSGVPDTEDHVSIGTTSNDPIISSAAVAQSIEVQENAALTINATLTVSDSEFFYGGVANSGQITNNGIFTITNAPLTANALLNNPTGSIINSGTMNIRPITYTLNAGIHNIGSINNTTTGDIFVDEAFRAINNGFLTSAGSFTNAGDIKIGSIAIIEASGLSNHSVSTFTNESSGNIYINHINGTGLNSSGDFINKGMISVGDSDAILSVGVSNTGTFLNDTDATIHVDDTALSGCVNAASFTNKGNLYLGGTNGMDDGLRSSNSGIFTNELDGEIMINNTRLSGINVFNGGLIRNKGNIHIGNTHIIGSQGIMGSAQFENTADGVINIHNTNTVGIAFSGSFMNDGDINIGYSGNIGSDGINCSGSASFMNQANGKINIVNTTSTGLKNNASFSNLGLIAVGLTGTVPSSGFGNTGDFINESSGTIQLKASLIGCNNFTGGILTNKGSIEIGENGQMLSYGFRNQVNSQLINDGGYIAINNISTIGFWNSESSASVLNKACSSIYIEGKIDNNGQIQNDGFLSLNTIQAHTPGDFTNNGVIEDIEGTFPLGGNLLNNETIIQKVTEPCDEISPAFVLGGSSIFNILGVFTNASCATSAGTYNDMTNTFTPNLTDGMYSLYVKVEDAIGGCTEVFNWKVDLTTPVPQANCQGKILELDINGVASLLAADIDNNSTDDCGIANYSLDEYDFDCSNLGTNTVTLTVTNLAGNTHSCTATVTVEDNTPPIAICKNKIVEIQSDATYTLIESDVFDANTSSDNCDITDVFFSANTYDCDDIGSVFSIFVLISDASGNSDFCSANITVAQGDDLPAAWNTTTIGTAPLGNDFEFDPCIAPLPENGEFTITGSGNNATSSTTDNVAFAGQSLCGDVSITAKIEDVGGPGYGGLMIRESLDANAKQVSLFSNQSNVLRQETRYTTGGPKQVNAFFKPSPIWLRLQRQGDWIFSYYSSDGNNFNIVHGVYVPMQYCVEVGLASFTFIPGTQTEAVFSNVSVSGSNSTTSIAQNQEESTVKPHHHISTSPYHQMNIFPNPAREVFTVKSLKPSREELKVGLYNSFGQLVGSNIFSVGQQELSWDIQALPQGSYWLKITGENQVQKIVIAR